MNNKNTYIALAVVFIASLGLVAVFHYFPVAVVGDLAGVPAIVALFGALFQLSRDRIAFERSERLEEAKNRFNIGAMSHMADIAFDKHVEFCEEYANAAYDATRLLFKKGAHESAVDSSVELFNIRIKWAVWLDSTINAKLEKYEGALRTIGSNAWLLKAMREDDDRTEAVEKAYGTIAQIMGFDTWRGKPVTEKLTVETVVVENLRAVLGIGELTRLRSTLVERAMENLK